jgi:hypothetical protein
MHQAPVTLLKERTFTGKLSAALSMPPGGNPLALSITSAKLSYNPGWERDIVPVFQLGLALVPAGSANRE